MQTVISLMSVYYLARRMVWITVLAMMIPFVVPGCASVSHQYELTPLNYKKRASTRSDGVVRVSTSVLSEEESIEVYGVPLAKKGIQPVWVEIENRDKIAYWLLSPGMDPNFFPASEAADAFTAPGQSNIRGELEQRFAELAFTNPIPAGATKAGFVLTNLDEGVKLVQVDLVATGQFRSFSIMANIPGFRADYDAREVFTRDIYAAEEFVDYTDDNAFRSALEALPCCVTNKSGTKDGDPLNLVIVGGLDDAFPALIRRGWRPTEQTWSGSVMKMATSALSGERYLYAPISPLYLFGRPQDFALQKARDNVHQRNHMRLWLSPLRYHGASVWVGQISRDIGSRLTIHSPYLTTHKIDPDVDEARTALTEDMAYSQGLAKLGLVKGVGAAPRNAPRQNLTTDPYFTDGARSVLIFDPQPKSLTDIKFLPWERSENGFIEKSIRQEK